MAARIILRYLGAYVLWIVTIALGVLAAATVRGTLEMTFAVAGWHPLTVRAVDKFVVLLLGVTLVAAMFLTEHCLRTAIGRGRVYECFWRIVAWHLGILPAAHAIQFALERAAGAPGVATAQILALELLVLLLAIGALRRGADFRRAPQR